MWINIPYIGASGLVWPGSEQCPVRGVTVTEDGNDPRLRNLVVEAVTEPGMEEA